MKTLLPCALIFASALFGQGNILTYAGSDALFAGAGQPAAAAQLVGPQNIAIDGQGNVYFSASGYSMVLKVTVATGIISVVAGNGLSAGGGDNGLAAGASLLDPAGLAFDTPGNLYIVDSYNSNVRKVDTNGIITTVAGDQGAGGFAGDGGLATEALLTNPTGIAVDKSGNLYIADRGNNRIRMVTPGGIISTIAGSSATGLSGDGGPASKATFSYPTGIAIDTAGNLYIADQENYVIRRISTSGIITTVAGNGHPGYAGDGGPAIKAQISAPTGVRVDASGNIYIADTSNQRIRRVDLSGNITTVAGNGTAGFSGDGSAATAAMFSTPVDVATDASGNVYVADLDNNRIRKVVPGGNVTTIAGTNTSIGDGGPSTQARLDAPWGVAVDATGNLYIADRMANRVRKVTPSGTITTVAGNGQTGNSGNGGPGPSAALSTPNGIAVDAAGNVYIADAGNNQIRRVDASTGVITAFAGTGGCCYAGTGTGGDGGAAAAAILFYPGEVTVDGLGNVYFTDFVQSNTTPLSFAVRRVTPDGKINTWAGGGPTVGFSGDGGSPLQAEFSSGINIAGGPDGSLYIADGGNNRVRKVDPAGATINTIAGNGQAASTGNGGAAIAAGVSNPWSVLPDAAGNLYIGDIPLVRKVSPSGIIGPYAGSGQYSFSGDGGPATAAALTGVPAMALDSGNNLYLVDSGNRRVRLVQPAVSPAITLSSTSLTFKLAAASSTSTTQTFVVTNGGQGTLNWAAAASTTAGGAWLSVAPASGSVLAGQPGTTVTVTANPSGLANGDYYGLIQVTSPSAASQVQMLTVRLTIATPGEDPPQVTPGGVVNDGSYSAAQVAPGTFVAIFGANFTDSASALIESGVPFPNELGGTSVTIGGEAVPLYFVTAGQINGILPFDLAVDTSLPIVVSRNGALSAPQSVSIVSSLPGVFTQSQNGLGIGDIEVFAADGSYIGIAGGGISATAGDAIVVYCTGLGDVSPRAVAGFPAPAMPLANTIDPVTMTISGVNVPVFFAGPAPGYVGLYQVNAIMPTGIAANAQAQLVLAQAGRMSPTVTIPVQ